MDTSRRFREELKAPYHFVADEKATLVKLFDVKAALFNIARRVTFVVGPGRKVLWVEEGADAINTSGAVAACSLKPPGALKVVAPERSDGGAADPNPRDK